MPTNLDNKKYTVADLYAEAEKLVRGEMAGIKKSELTETENKKSQELAKAISKMVLKEMKLV
ncbi:MAG: hypothetical protein ABIH50_06410 [bacterium]